jgi:hypothetical protein
MWFKQEIRGRYSSLPMLLMIVRKAEEKLVIDFMIKASPSWVLY